MSSVLLTCPRLAYYKKTKIKTEMYKNSTKSKHFRKSKNENRKQVLKQIKTK